MSHVRMHPRPFLMSVLGALLFALGRYRAHVLAHLRTATLWPMGTLSWGLANCVVILTGAVWGPRWGLTFGRVSAFLFLADLFLHPFTDLPEVYSETQTAISGWRKIALLELPVVRISPDAVHVLDPVTGEAIR